MKLTGLMSTPKQTAESLLLEAIPHAEWHDKHIHPFNGETYQNWRLTVYLPVPLSQVDKTPEAALQRALLAAAPRPAPAEPQPAAQQEPLCMCKDRALSACPGEWEPGCDLGNNPAHVRAAEPQQEPAIEHCLWARNGHARCPQQERKPLTDEQIDRHSIAAVDCPPSSTVILVSSLRRLLGITATKGGA